MVVRETSSLYSTLIFTFCLFVSLFDSNHGLGPSTLSIYKSREHDVRQPLIFDSNSAFADDDADVFVRSRRNTPDSTTTSTTTTPSPPLNTTKIKTTVQFSFSQNKRHQSFCFEPYVLCCLLQKSSAVIDAIKCLLFVPSFCT